MLILAILSLILAIIGLLIPPFSILAIILEETYRYRNNKKYDGEAKGNTFSKIALVIALLNVLIQVAIILTG